MPLTRGGVILSTYHSAKGSEFDHVFVLNEGLRRHGLETPADDTRALYVALTRGRQGVTLLRREEDCHSTLLNREYQMALKELGVQAFPLPTAEPLPARIRYSLDGDPADLYVSAPEVLDAPGRAAVQAYACKWGDLRLQNLRLLSASGPVARLSRSGKLNQRLSRAAGGTLRAVGATVLRCERDEEWYVIARYNGAETHHYHVLPTFEVEEVLKP